MRITRPHICGAFGRLLQGRQAWQGVMGRTWLPPSMSASPMVPGMATLRRCVPGEGWLPTKRALPRRALLRPKRFWWKPQKDYADQTRSSRANAGRSTMSGPRQTLYLWGTSPWVALATLAPPMAAHGEPSRFEVLRLWWGSASVLCVVSSILPGTLGVAWRRVTEFRAYARLRRGQGGRAVPALEGCWVSWAD